LKQVRVNIRSVANTSKVRKEKRNGRDVLIVPSATLPDNVVMNGIRYGADEIAKSFATLNKTPAPYGHPVVNGKFVSARDPEGINIGWIGAHNENARQENGRVFLDKVIDVEVASRSAEGKAVIAAINAGDPIHTSTGLLCELEPVEGEEGVKANARNMYFDHDAILLNEEGAATPEQGVGMLVNANGEAQEVEVINSDLGESADRELDWAVDHLARALERRERVPMLERMKAALLDAFSTRDKPSTTEGNMDMDKEQFDALSAKVNGLAENAVTKEDLTTALTNAMKPLLDAQAAIVANAKAKDEAELATHVAAIVKANLLDEASAKELTLNAARKLAEKAKPGVAFGMNGAPLTTNADDEFAGVDLNAAMEVK
jgi:hypothetical protein